MARIDNTFKKARIDNPFKMARIDNTFKKARIDNPFKMARIDNTFKKARIDNPFKMARIDNTFKKARIDNPFKMARIDNTFKKARIDNTFKKARIDNTFKKARIDNTFKKARIDNTLKRTRLEGKSVNWIYIAMELVTISVNAAENNLELVKKDILQVIQTCPIPDLHDIQLEFDYGKDTKKYSCANKSTSHCFRQTQLGGVMAIHQISNTSFYDGDKWICYDPGLAPDPENCLVYSFGIGNEWSFDDAMAKYGCQVDTLGNIMRMLGHEGRRLDYLKIDIEGSEIPALEQVFRDSPHLLTQVSQLGIEVHPGMYPFDGNLDKTGKFYRVWRIYHLLECLGFQLLHMNVNQYPGTQYKWKDTLQSCCYELVWVMPPPPRPIQT
ncbi:hypothetical protein Pmani_015984 [Petrolisthes manimaculis]|uniref:Methyltransferase FkbM domain-containing protein n=1 Tax=Petrolisthes manimaculis TaxID=1843537 RepID=A0AAE1PQM4_9EUCA|nr:hypothetical protein Pmani_015984 [Petrolisthes manimaculis]